MLRKSGTNSSPGDSFVDTNPAIIELVSVAAAMNRAANCEKDFAKVSADLAVLVESGDLGRALYMDRMGQVLAQHVELHIDGALPKTFGPEGGLGKDKYDSGKAEVMKILGPRHRWSSCEARAYCALQGAGHDNIGIQLV